MKEKIILSIIDLFCSVIPIIFLIGSAIGVIAAFNNDLIPGLIAIVSGLISAAGSYGFGIILSAAYVYLWKEKNQQQS